MLKKELRKLYLNKREALSSEEFEEKNTELTNRLFSRVVALGKEDVFIFLPINKEFDCRPLAVKLWEKGLKTYIPVTDFKNKSMFFAQYTSQTVLIEKQYGLLEPEDCAEYKASEAVVVTPLLISDNDKYRVGYGGGFYDRYLSKKPSLYKLGVSFFTPVEKVKDINEFDVKLNEVIY